MWPKPWPIPEPHIFPKIFPEPAPPAVIPLFPKPYNGPTREQFEEFLELIRAARKFDIKTGQKDCPAKDKTDWLIELAEHLGVDKQRVVDALK